MGYKRHVIASNLPFQYYSLAVDETRAVFRLLNPKEFFSPKEDAQIYSAELLSTTQKLASEVAVNDADKIFEVNGEELCIVAEVVIDKTDPFFSRMWVPGAHFVTWFDGYKFRVQIKGALTYFDCRNTAQYIRYNGGLWLFDLWVRNPQDPVTACSRSITTTEDATVITNVEDLGEVWTAENVMTGATSKWLNLAYDLTPSSETVAPDGWIDFTLKLKDGKTGELADDVTWDGYIVEAVDGYAPHKRVPIVNGVGHFRACALGLQAGETMRVKINHRFYTSRAEATVQVVSND